MTKVLHLSHPEFDASTKFPGSVLLTNVAQPIYERSYHTSVGDMSPRDILSVSDRFDIINFIPYHFNLQSDIYYETALILQHLSHSKLVTGFQAENAQDFLSMDVTTRPSEPMVWVFGCSHSHGVGLTADQLTFGQHISQATGLPLKTVSKPGSSTQWSLRHIMNANFQPNDLVIWQLTAPERFSYGLPPVENRLAQVADQHILKTFTDQHILFTQLTLFNQGLQYLKSQPVKFSVVSLNPKSTIFYPCLLEYTKHKEYCYALDFNLDFGTDQIHFGPLSHKALAQRILDHVNYTNA